jgi:hypothetical protein
VGVGLVRKWATRTEIETLWFDLQRFIEGNGDGLYVFKKPLILGGHLP